jgi:hypothetical protein
MSAETTKVYKKGVGFSVSVATLSTIERWAVDIAAERPGETVNRSDVVTVVVATLEAIGWKPGMKVMLQILPLSAASPVTTPGSRAIQPISKGKGPSVKL